MIRIAIPREHSCGSQSVLADIVDGLPSAKGSKGPNTMLLDRQRRRLVLLSCGNVPFPDGNAPANYLVELAQGFRAIGLRPIIVSLVSNGDQRPRVGKYRSIHFVRVGRVPTSSPAKLLWRCIGETAAALRLAQLLARHRHRIAAVLNLGGNASIGRTLVTGVAGRSAQVPVINLCAEEQFSLQLDGDKSILQKLRLILLNYPPILLNYIFLCRLYRGIACITPALQGLFRKLGHPSRRLCHIPNVRFSEGAGSAALPIRPGIASELRLLYAGQISTTKEAIIPLIQAIRILHDRGIQVALRIVGDGPTSSVSKIQKEITVQGIGNCACYLGFVDRDTLESELRQADLCVLLKRDTIVNRFNFPTKLMDYLAHAKPVLMSPLALHRTYFSHGHNAVIAEGESAEAIAAAIEWFYENRGKGPCIGKEAAKLLRTEFDAVVRVREMCRQFDVVV